MLNHVLYQDDDIVVLKKESGDHVHPPEDKRVRVQWNRILIYRVQDFLKKKVFPVHRLDVPTMGILIMALNKESANLLCQQFSGNNVLKKYKAVVRGYVKSCGEIDLPLELDSTGEPVGAFTQYQCLKTVELNYAVSDKHKSSRYSLVEVTPKTGRYHQIRRHFNRISHPLIGDCEHGDSRHNRFFREQLNISGLCLMAHEITFQHPKSKLQMQFKIEDDEKWKIINKLFDYYI